MINPICSKATNEKNIKIESLNWDSFKSIFKKKIILFLVKIFVKRYVKKDIKMNINNYIGEGIKKNT